MSLWIVPQVLILSVGLFQKFDLSEKDSSSFAFPGNNLEFSVYADVEIGLNIRKSSTPIQIENEDSVFNLIKLIPTVQNAPQLSLSLRQDLFEQNCGESFQANIIQVFLFKNKSNCLQILTNVSCHSNKMLITFMNHDS